MSQRNPTEEHTERQHWIDESELFVRKQTVHQECPDDSCQQYLVSSEGEGATMEEERKVRANHDREALGEVPVPGMGTVEISHTVEDVEF